jgi:hypothetical protein
MGTPLVLAAIPIAVGYGTLQAQAQATDEQVERITDIVEEMGDELTGTTTDTALNTQAIRAIADGLAAQQRISESTDEKLGQLIQIMLESQK